MQGEQAGRAGVKRRGCTGKMGLQVRLVSGLGRFVRVLLGGSARLGEG